MKQRNRQSMAKRAGKRLAPARRRSQRRGVLLLAVLSILVLFLLVGTTFLITSGQYRTASKVQEKAVRTTFQPADVLERALMQLLRDTNNPNSVVRYHSLLRDLYGVDGFIGRPADSSLSSKNIAFLQQNFSSAIVLPHYAGATKQSTNTEPLGPTNGQFIEFYVGDDPTYSRLDPKDRNTVGLDFDAQGLPVDHQLPTADGYYNGCVLTFIGGPCRGSSVRVIDYDFIQTGQLGAGGGLTLIPVARLRTTAPSRSDGRPLNLDGNGVLTDLVDGDASDLTTPGHRFIVNGRPFNGTGVGFNPLALSHDLEQSAPSPRLSAIEAVETTNTGDGEKRYGFEVALTPNATQYNRSRIAHLKSNRFRDPFAEGLTFIDGDPTNPSSDYVYLNSDPANAFAELATPRYGNFAGPGDTDESYDAPDSQNMALALQSPEPRLRGRVVDANGGSSDPDAYYLANGGVAPAYLDLDGVTIPSFHRPALANFWFHRLYNSGWLSGIGAADRVRLILEPYNADGTARLGDDQTSAQVAAIKRKFLMRPLREDHPDFDGSNALSRYGTETIRAALDSGALVNTGTGEITFPFWEAVGPWDVDNDGDGVPDSVWVDVGLPVQKTEDGRWYKPLVAMLVEDLDGRLNLNAHGSLDDLASLDQNGAKLDTSQTIDTGGNVAGWGENLAQDYANNFPLYSSDQLPTGEGWGTAEVSLRSILSPGLPLAGWMNQGSNATTQSFESNPQFDDYARLLAGRPDPALAGRTVENALRVAEPFGRYGSAPSELTFGALNGVSLYQPGRSYSTQAGIANQPLRDATEDPLTDFERVGAPDYTFSNADAITPVDLPNGYSSPPNQRARYAVGLSAAGASVSEATNAVNLLRNQAIADGVIPATDPLLTWRQDVKNTPNDSPYELNLSPESRRLLPVSIAAIRSSYDTDGDGAVDANAAPLNDDAPFSAAELERLLRALDADAPALPDRLWNLVDAFDPIKLAAATRLERELSLGTPPPIPLPDPNSITSLDAVAAAAKAAINRRSVTTDSWDLPVPNENWSERLTLGADGLPGVPWGDSNLSGDRDLSGAATQQIDVDDQGDDDGDGLFDEGDEAIIGYNDATQTHTFTNGDTATYDDLFTAGCDDYVVVMRKDPPASPRITDYLRYRITLELLRNGTIAFTDFATPAQRAVVEKHLDEILIGSNTRPSLLVRSRSQGGGIDDSGVAGADMRNEPPLFSYGGLLAPELLAGHRMDLNRPLGDGRDNGNGIDDDGNGLIDDPAEMRSMGMDEEDFVLGQSFPNPYDIQLNGIVDEPGEAGEPSVDRNKNGTIEAGEYLDRNRNGAYDPPRDVLWAADTNGDGDHLDPGESTPFNYTAGADANGNGAFITTNGLGIYEDNALVNDDGRNARQLMARHLYCLMLSLMDENYVAPYDPNDLQVFSYLNPNLGVIDGTLPSDDPTRKGVTPDAFGLAIELFEIEFATEIASGTLLDEEDVNMVKNGNNGNQVAYGSHTLKLADDLQNTRRLAVLADARSLAQRKLTRRMIAQWAVNVVDFRDPDAIQTAFEYDENPWDGWNVIDTTGETLLGNLVYPIDGDLATDETRGQVRDPQQAGIPVLPLSTAWEDLRPVRVLNQSRGVVWGAERPELLLTEGLAWHDRRAMDTEIELAPNPASEQSDGGLIGGGELDDDLDQIVRPKGFTYLEAYNPWTGDPQRPAEFYSHVDQDGVMKLESGLRLDRLSTEAFAFDPVSGPVRSPVWRIAVVEEDPRLRNATLPAPVSAAGSTSLLDYWVSDDPDPFGDVLAPNIPGITNPAADAWEKLPNDWDYTGFADQEPYFDLSAERSREAFVVLQNETLMVATDADGVALSLGLRETTPRVPDTSFPNFDRFISPVPIKQTVEVPISSYMDGDDGVVQRHRFSKPVRHIERAIYPVTPFAADNGLHSLPLPNIKPLASREYDSSGYRIPVREITVDMTVQSLSWKQTSLWDFSARTSTTGNGLTFNTSRFGAFDWFDLDSDGNRFDERNNAAGNQHIEAVELAPLLPGRRAVIGTQGAVYQTDEIGSIDGNNRARFLANTAEPYDDPLGPIFLEGRFTAFTAPEPSIYDQSQTQPPLISRLGRFEMIPSTEADQHQFAVRMNGLTESTTAYQNPALAYNMTVAPAAANAAARTGPPVIAVPIDNFSISEPIGQYLLRALELDPGAQPKTSFIRRDDLLNRPAAGVTDYANAEGYFERTEGSQQLGFDEPFDVLPELVKNQTTPNYRSVHLERLANPLLPWNPPPYQRQVIRVGLGDPDLAPQQHDPTRPINPYLPVDAMPLDLTALNTLGDENQEEVDRGDAKFVRPGAIANGAENLYPHRQQRNLPSPPVGAVPQPDDRYRNPFVARSVEREQPWGAFRSLWGATVGRILWRQARPTSASELVIGTKKIPTNGKLASGDATGDLHIATLTADDYPPVVARNDTNPPTALARNGFDFSYEFEQSGNPGKLPTSVLQERKYQLGWRMTLGFASPGMGRTFVGGNLLWRSLAPKLAAPEQVDLDGDGSASDLLGFGDVSERVLNVFRDNNANGRPDELENINWDTNLTASGIEDAGSGVAVIDAHEAAYNPLRDQTTTPELHWPNRPFASAGELLQVPAWGGSRMLTHFSAFNWLHTQGPEFWHHTQINPYNGEAAVMHDGLDYTVIVNNEIAVKAARGPNDLNGNFADDESALDPLDGVTPASRDNDNYLDFRATNELRFRETLGHFGHLTNFFQTARYPAFVQTSVETDFPSPASALNPDPVVPVRVATPIPRGAAHFYRLLDYVHVPTPFTASKTLLNPEVFGEDNLEPGDARAGLSAPFNSLGTYREPGRVNLNTIVGRRDRGADPSAAFDWWSEVYDGLMHRTQDTSLLEFTNGELLKMGHLGPAWRDVALSRRGYVQSTFDPNQNPTDTTQTLATAAQNRLDYSPRRMHPDFPTFFANPFRAPGEGANVPLAHMVQTGVDATLLRAHPLSPGADGAWGRRGVDDQTVDKGGLPAVDGDLIRDDASEAGAVMLELGGGGETVPVPDQPTVDQLNADVVLARFRHSREELGGHADGRILRRGALPDSLLQDALRPNLAHYHDPRQVAPGPSVTLNPLQLPPVKLLPSEDGSEFESPDTAFANTEIGRRVTPVPLFSGATIEPSLDTERNATKRFQPIQRMSSLATTRSNVYAVWITVGFFEVKPASEDARIWPRYMTDANGDGIGDTFGSTLYPIPAQAELSFLQVYPEGWTLGKELGFDTGTNERHRGFYMVDRSRPVAFRPGEDANVSDAVLVRRRLE